MYFDTSCICDNEITLNVLLKRYEQAEYTNIILNYEFIDSPIKIIPMLSNFNKTKIHLHYRITLQISQNTSLLYLTQVPAFQGILAVRPMTQKLFHTICVEYDNYDLICFNMKVRIPFMLRRNPVYQALKKGKYFEINYGYIFNNENRLSSMQNIVSIMKATGGKNIVVGSYANSPQRIKTIYDIISLLSSLSFKKNKINSIVKQYPQQLLNTSLHRRYFKGAVKQICSTQFQLLDKISTKTIKQMQKHKQNMRKLIKEQQNKLMQFQLQKLPL